MDAVQEILKRNKAAQAQQQQQQQQATQQPCVAQQSLTARDTDLPRAAYAVRRFSTGRCAARACAVIRRAHSHSSSTMYPASRPTRPCLRLPHNLTPSRNTTRRR